jgi:peptide/nickel transport system substrate-binding protein
MPGSWADDPGLLKPSRDTVAAQKLIENAGWALGPDGVFAKDGVRLAADILVRGDAASDRIQMADLIASQARDCGMDLRSRPTRFDDLLTMLNHYPHNIPGTNHPVDLYVGIWAIGVDPADGFDFFASSNISDAKHPDGFNWTGFSDPTLDALVTAGRATYDPAARTRIYREAQQELAAQQPYLFLWANNTYDVVRAAVRTVGGPLDLTVPNWTWQPERMVVAASGS